MTDPQYVPMPDVTCGTPCADQHTYSLGECALSCASIDGGTADKSWTVACPRCKAPANKPCLRLNGTASGTSCAHRWNAYDAQQKARPSAPARPATTPEGPPVTNETTSPTECPAGVHSLFDPCPGDCGKLLEDATLHTEQPPAPTPLAFKNSTDTIRRLLARQLAMPPSRSRILFAPHELTPDERVRRDRYAGVIREEIKGRTVPPLIPGQLPALGATEYDIAHVVLAERDDELTKARTERDAALRIAEVWSDAPDPLARAMAADLLTAIGGAQPAPDDTPPTPDPELRDVIAAAIWERQNPGRRYADCEYRWQADAEEDADAVLTVIGAHVTKARDERDRYAAALDTVRNFNKLVADGSCRVQAAEQARDTLNLLERSLNAPGRPSHAEKGQP